MRKELPREALFAAESFYKFRFFKNIPNRA